MARFRFFFRRNIFIMGLLLYYALLPTSGDHLRNGIYIDETELPCSWYYNSKSQKASPSRFSK